MKTIFIAVIVFFSCFSCGKIDVSDNNKEVKNSQVEHVTSISESNNSTEMVNDFDDGKKKYNPLTCSTNPKNLGTECSIPGDKCNEYTCKIVYTTKIGLPALSAKEIDYYAQKEAESLFKTGLIDAENFNYFKKLIADGISTMEKESNY